MSLITNPVQTKIPRQKLDQILNHLYEVYPDGKDPWGLNLEKIKTMLQITYPVYKNYFKTRVFGKEHIKDTPYMVVANHSGQIAIDGLLILIAFLLEVEKPRILRAMMERFVPRIPFVGMWATEGGCVLGDRQSCSQLIDKKESPLVFPEGVRGISKNTSDYYKLQNFSQGFFRICLTSKIDILPIAVVGAEEIFPWVYHAKNLAKFLKLPAFPLSPLYFPLPSPVDIYIGAPYRVPTEDISSDSPDFVIDTHVRAIEKQVQQLMENGLKNRRKFFAAITPSTGWRQ